MGQVQTVLGPVDADRLGVTLMHEHVFVLSPEIQQNWPTGWDEEQGVADAVVRLNELAAAGVSTIVDLTVVGLGRNIRLVKRVAEQVDLNIVVATGLYTYDALPHYFDFRSAAYRPRQHRRSRGVLPARYRRWYSGLRDPGGHPQVRHR